VVPYQLACLREHPTRGVDTDHHTIGADSVAEQCQVPARTATYLENRVAALQAEPLTALRRNPGASRINGPAKRYQRARRSYREATRVSG
jgi:hypothetical protein